MTPPSLRSEKRGPMTRAYFNPEDGNVTVPCSGVVQAGEVLPIIHAAPEMLAALKALLPPDGEPGVGEWWGLEEAEQRERIRTLLAKIDGAAA